MIDIDNKIVHRDIIEKNFICDLCKCKGGCCVDGISGAPLEEQEVEVIKQLLPKIYERLTSAGKSVVDVEGVW
ncbi:MAG: DUF3109 family protein, partial [Bacteroidales bacterium]|nr:DUF3109 family protein [Bacteroidales bacterium]